MVVATTHSSLLLLLLSVCLTSLIASPVLCPRCIYLANDVTINTETTASTLTTTSTNTYGYYLVHMNPDRTLDATQRVVPQELFDTFNTAGTYIPSNTYLLYTTDSLITTFKTTSPRVLWIDTLKASYKVNSNIVQYRTKGTTTSAYAEAALLMVTITTNEDATNLATAWTTAFAGMSALASTPVTVAKAKEGLLAVTISGGTVPSTVINYLSAQSAVEYISLRPSISLFASLTPVEVVQGNVKDMMPVWNATFTGSGETITIADTGLDYFGCFFNDTTAPGISTKEKVNSNANHRKVKTIFQFECATDTCCTNVFGSAIGNDSSDTAAVTNAVTSGHGTLAAGIAAGLLWSDSVASNVSKSDGVAPNAKLVIRDLSPSTGTQKDSILLPCLLGPMADAAKGLSSFIHSNAWGAICDGTACTGSMPYGDMAKQVDDYVFANSDVLMIFAAGNRAQQQTGLIAEPGNAKNVLTVGSSDSDQPAYQSALGPTRDGRIKPDILAPGTDVISAQSQGSVNSTAQANCPTQAMSGTSLAASVAAGAAALLRQYLASGLFQGTNDPSKGIGKPSATLVKNLMTLSAIVLPKLASATQSFSFAELNVAPTFSSLVMPDLSFPGNDQGFGRLSIDHVILAKSFGYTLFFTSDTTTNNVLVTSVTPASPMVDYCINVGNSAKPLRVVLSWSEPAASLLAGKALINNLDLMVHSDAADVYGNMGSAFDNLNNVEVVHFPAAFGGRTRITVQLQQLNTQDATAGQAFVISILGEFTGTPTATAECPTSCPGPKANPCFGAGACTNGRCVCNANYYGIDCSMSTFEYKANTTVCGDCGAYGCALTSGSATCTCFSDSVRGFYTGTKCDACATNYAHDPTTNRCTVSTTCSSNGQYDGTSGKCVCNSNVTTTGVWGGPSCEQCASGYVGANCKCPIDLSTGLVCGGHGYCAADGCHCSLSADTGYFAGSGCADCAVGWFGDDVNRCKFSTNCSNHGDFVNGRCRCYANGTTGFWDGIICSDCLAGYTYTPYCKCKMDTTTLVTCSGRGVCGPSGCVCNRTQATGFWKDSTNMATNCDVCADNYYGNILTTGKPHCRCYAGNGTSGICSGHGECTEQGCSCKDTGLDGHWAGAECAACATNWKGATCRCSNHNNLECNGNGKCTTNGCNCTRDWTGGYWMDSNKTNSFCDACYEDSEFKYSSPATQCKCQMHKVIGRGELECNGNGQCLNGGRCKCFANPVGGFWIANDTSNVECGRCNNTYSGRKCNCRLFDGKLCGKHGTCDLGTTDGCTCDDTFATGHWEQNANGDCSVCKSGWSGVPGNDPGCRCWLNCNTNRGNCTASGCVCYADAAKGFFNGSEENGMSRTIFVNYTGDCAKCLAPYQFENDPGSACKCAPGICASISGNSVNRTVGRFELSSATVGLAIPPTTSSNSTALYSFLVGAPNSPSGAPTENVRLGQTSFSLKVSQLGATVSTAALRRMFIQDTYYYFVPYIEISVIFPPATAVVTEKDTKVDYKAKDGAPRLMYVAGTYLSVADTCGDSAYSTIDWTTRNLTTRVCKLQITNAQTPVEFAIFAKLYSIPGEGLQWWMYPVLAGVIVFVGLILGLVFVYCRRRLRREAEKRKAKERVIEFIMKRKEMKGQRPLRVRLGLRSDEKMTPQMCAQRLLEVSKRRRQVIKNLGKRLMPQVAMPNAAQAAHILGMIALYKPPGKLWEFKDHHQELLEAVSKMRMLFQQDPATKQWNLRPGCLPDTQQYLLQMQIEIDRHKKSLTNYAAGSSSPQAQPANAQSPGAAMVFPQPPKAIPSQQPAASGSRSLAVPSPTPPYPGQPQ